MSTIVHWERLFALLQVAIVVALLAGALTSIALLYVIGRIVRRTRGRYHALITDEGAEIHAPLPEFSGYTPQGQLVRGADFAGEEYVLLLVSPECDPCHSLLAAVEPVRRSLVEPPAFVVVAEFPQAEAQACARKYRLDASIIVDPEGAVRSQLGVLRTPYGFLVDPQGIVRMKGVLNHRDHLEALISRRGRSMGSVPWESLVEADAAAGESRLVAVGETG